MNTSSIHAGSIGYRGRVTVSWTRGSKVLMQRQFKNSGLQPLFSGLCSLLAGTATTDTIRNLIPAKIGIYTINDTENLPSSDSSWTALYTGSNGASPIKPASPLRDIDAKAAVQTLVDTNIAEEVILQATIPFETITADSIYVFALYPATATSAAEDCSKALALYKLTEGNAWAPFKPSHSTGLDALVIEWRMDFSNKGE